MSVFRKMLALGAIDRIDRMDVSRPIAEPFWDEWHKLCELHEASWLNHEEYRSASRRIRRARYAATLRNWLRSKTAAQRRQFYAQMHQSYDQCGGRDPHNPQRDYAALI